MDEVQVRVVFLDVVSGVLRLGQLRVDRIAVDAATVVVSMQRQADLSDSQQQYQQPAQETRGATRGAATVCDAIRDGVA